MNAYKPNTNLQAIRDQFIGDLIRAVEHVAGTSILGMNTEIIADGAEQGKQRFDFFFGTLSFDNLEAVRKLKTAYRSTNVCEYFANPNQKEFCFTIIL